MTTESDPELLIGRVIAFHRGGPMTNDVEKLTASLTPRALDFDAWYHQVATELSRAERYRVFVSLLVFEIGQGSSRTAVSDQVAETLRRQTRNCDYQARVNSRAVAILMPETSRQGAESAARRLLATLEQSGLPIDSSDEAVTLRMASYPDSGGTQSLIDLLSDLASHQRN